MRDLTEKTGEVARRMARKELEEWERRFGYALTHKQRGIALNLANSIQEHQDADADGDTMAPS